MTELNLIIQALELLDKNNVLGDLLEELKTFPYQQCYADGLNACINTGHIFKPIEPAPTKPEPVSAREQLQRDLASGEIKTVKEALRRTDNLFAEPKPKYDETGLADKHLNDAIDGLAEKGIHPTTEPDRSHWETTNNLTKPEFAPCIECGSTEHQSVAQATEPLEIGTLESRAKTIAEAFEPLAEKPYQFEPCELGGIHVEWYNDRPSTEQAELIKTAIEATIEMITTDEPITWLGKDYRWLKPIKEARQAYKDSHA